MKSPQTREKLMASNKKGLAMHARFCPCWIAVAGLLLASAAALAQEKTNKHEAPAADKLSREHEQLARLAGDYTTFSKFWIKPGDEPRVSKGTAKITSVLGGRFLLEENTGTQFGQPFQGLRLSGYNSGTKQYQASWVWSRTSAIMTMTGTSKGDGKPIEWMGTFTDEKGEKQTLHVITRTLDADQFVVELFAKTPDGKKGPTLETTYVRKK
jgi:hypothetical protein